jgi:pseudo-rSAM protein
MISKKNLADYWFKIEPYVHVNITNGCVLLYNTLDGVSIVSYEAKVIELLKEILQKDNCGVVFLTHERYKQNDINNFIRKLREKYMGGVIDVDLSKGKPVQLLPFSNLSNTHELYKKHNFSSGKILRFLSEISIYVDHTTNITNLIPFLQSLPGNLAINIVGNLENVTNYIELLSFLAQLSSSKKMICAYTNVIPLQPVFGNNFSYLISVDFLVDMQQWNYSRQLLLNQDLPFEYIFEISSFGDCQQAKKLVEQFEIEKYQLKPVYTGNNIVFFEKNVFITKGDILSEPISLKDIFANQSMNIYDFGKINIMPNGDVYANVKHPVLGNIYTNSIHEIIYKEVEEGKSWLRIRNQEPCSTCIYQWLCPSPSDYEMVIGRPNLCHINKR